MLLAAPYRTIAGERSGSKAWDAAKLHLALDFHLASMAEEIQTSGTSSFSLPIVARSVCIRHVHRFPARAPHGGIAGGDDTFCPLWEHTFPRGLYNYIGSAKHSKLYQACIESQLVEGHPCKGVGSLACEERLLGAMARSG